LHIAFSTFGFAVYHGQDSCIAHVKYVEYEHLKKTGRVAETKVAKLRLQAVNFFFDNFDASSSSTL